MTVDQAAAELKKIGKMAIGADKLKTLHENLHGLIFSMVYNENDPCANDTFEMGDPEMMIEFNFLEEEFSARIIRSRPGASFEKYEQLELQSSEQDQDAFVRLAQIAKTEYSNNQAKLRALLDNYSVKKSDYTESEHILINKIKDHESTISHLAETIDNYQQKEKVFRDHIAHLKKTSMLALDVIDYNKLDREQMIKWYALNDYMKNHQFD